LGVFECIRDFNGKVEPLSVWTFLRKAEKEFHPIQK